MKKLLIGLLCAMSFTASAQGYRMMTNDGARILTYSGNQVVYTRFSLPLHCKFVSSYQGVDNEGLAFRSDGFSCTKDLFVVTKTWLDTGLRAIVEVDPRDESKREAFTVDVYKAY